MAENLNSHSVLTSAKTAKNDEFYTQLADIEQEMTHYRQHFYGKTIFLNCDDPETSYFWVYFSLNFDFLGLKSLISTHYVEDIEKNGPAAQREVYEEVGLKPDYDFDFEESITYKIARDRLKTVTLFLSRFNPDQKIELQKSEIGDYKWATLAEANSCLNYEELKELLKKAQEYIENEISR